MLDVLDFAGKPFKVIPDDVLSLAVERRQIGEAWCFLVADHRLVDQFVDPKNGFPESPMGNQHVKALEGAVQRSLLGPWNIEPARRGSGSRRSLPRRLSLPRDHAQPGSFPKKKGAAGCRPTIISVYE